MERNYEDFAQAIIVRVAKDHRKALTRLKRVGSLPLANQAILIYNDEPKPLLTENEVWLMPFGLLLDLWECHKQYNGVSKPKREHFIGDIIPEGM